MQFVVCLQMGGNEATECLLYGRAVTSRYHLAMGQIQTKRNPVAAPNDTVIEYGSLEGDVTAVWIRSILRGVMEAVIYCHTKGVVHGSLGSGSVLLSTFDDYAADSLKIQLDNFGFAAYLPPIKGTPSLASPVASPQLLRIRESGRRECRHGNETRLASSGPAPAGDGDLGIDRRQRCHGSVFRRAPGDGDFQRRFCRTKVRPQQTSFLHTAVCTENTALASRIGHEPCCI